MHLYNFYLINFTCCSKISLYGISSSLQTHKRFKFRYICAVLQIVTHYIFMFQDIFCFWFLSEIGCKIVFYKSSILTVPSAQWYYHYCRVKQVVNSGVTLGIIGGKWWKVWREAALSVLIAKDLPFKPLSKTRVPRNDMFWKINEFSASPWDCLTVWSLWSKLTVDLAQVCTYHSPAHASKAARHELKNIQGGTHMLEKRRSHLPLGCMNKALWQRNEGERMFSQVNESYTGSLHHRYHIHTVNEIDVSQHVLHEGWAAKWVNDRSTEFHQVQLNSSATDSDEIMCEMLQ